jgi:hypothetical protein
VLNISCLLTNDVETTSILNHKLRDKTAEYLLTQGMPRLLDLYDKYNVKTGALPVCKKIKLKPCVLETTLIGFSSKQGGIAHGTTACYP